MIISDYDSGNDLELRNNENQIWVEKSNVPLATMAYKLLTSNILLPFKNRSGKKVYFIPGSKGRAKELTNPRNIFRH